jgi:uncharacterized membrane protein YqjE
MEPKSTGSPGFVGSLRVLGDSILASVQDRIGLAALELQEEKFRLVQIFFWIGAVLVAGAMAMTFASLVLVYLFWESARLAVLGGLALLYGGVLIAAMIAFRRCLARQPKLLAGTLEELKEDRECIRMKN